MNRAARCFLAAAGMAILTADVGAAFGAANQDPDWPCVQRKVPELSLAQIWTGPELPAGPRDWSSDRSLASLVAELSARRVPLDEAQQRLRDFAGGLPADQAEREC